MHRHRERHDSLYLLIVLAALGMVAWSETLKEGTIPDEVARKEDKGPPKDSPLVLLRPGRNAPDAPHHDGPDAEAGRAQAEAERSVPGQRLRDGANSAH